MSRMRAVELSTFKACAAIYDGGHLAEIMERHVDPEGSTSGVERRMSEADGGYAAVKGSRRLEIGTPDFPVW